MSLWNHDSIESFLILLVHLHIEPEIAYTRNTLVTVYVMRIHSINALSFLLHVSYVEL